jgi:NAD(P)-dependent dehydrogenase (short-subunit alcohol dehydrogenase family)
VWSSAGVTTGIDLAQRIDCEYLVDVCLEAYLHMAVYSATKAGLIAFTHTIGGEVGPIRVNAICPGDPCAFGPAGRRARPREGYASGNANRKIWLN